MNTKYHEAICKEMKEFAKDPKTIFLGQQVLSEDFYKTLTDVPKEKRREMPVAEEMQMGLSIGLALKGYLPISIYQRMDFIPRAFDQIVNHLNLFEQLSRGLYNPKVIIRTTIGSTKPLNAGLQHTQDLSTMLAFAVDFPVYMVTTPEEVHKAYNTARTIDSSIVIIERQELYAF